MAATPWASVVQVTALTGVTVTELDRSMAVNAIELHTGLIEEVERVDMTGRDRYWLKLATCYQAAWLLAQPDYLQRNAVSTANQDGASATGGNSDWLTLAPLARKAIKRMSFKVMTINPTRDDAFARLNVLSEAYDDRLRWSPV